MTLAKRAVCPECGQTVPVVTRTISSGRAGRTRVFAAHSPAEYPDSMCPGAYCVPPRSRYNRTTTAKETKTRVTTAHAEDLGLDPCDGACAWYNHCEAHGAIVGHATLTLARMFASSPTEWCEDCREGVPADPTLAYDE